MSKHVGSFIANKLDLDPDQSLSRWPKLSPVKEEPLFDTVEASAAQIEAALTSADRALAHWRRIPVADRARALKTLADLIETNKDEFAQIEVRETGRPVREFYDYDIPVSAGALGYFAQLIQDQGDGARAEAGSDSRASVVDEPYGICFGIGAWNYPLQIAVWKMAPALAAGNVMIFKPSELTPSSVLRLAELCLDAGLPSGAFQVVQGRERVAEQLIRSLKVRKVSLTGSVATGRRVAALAGECLKPVTMELGGKSPLIILDDADVNEAARLAVLANFYSSGQVCTNGTRVFVPASFKDDFLKEVISLTQSIRLGDPVDPVTEMGPLISRAQRDKAEQAIAEGVREGARLLTGGQRPDGFSKGYYLTPAVFADVTDEMSLAREEIFGPVMAVLTFKDEAEVIARANQLEFGLAAGVISQDAARAERLAAQLEAGICWINTYNDTPVHLPFGGVKASGFGRENGIQGLRQYQQTKTILTALRGVAPVFSGFQ